MSAYARKGEQPLYAPAAPFGTEIDRWLETHRRRLRLTENGVGLEQLAGRADIPTKSLREYRNGGRTLITLVCADRLAMALDVPLWLLAEEFLPRGEAIERWCREKATA